MSTARPRITFLRAFRAALMRLARSPLMPVHLACGLAGGAACGWYFSTARWDPAFGADAYVQLLGAMMPLMASIVCALALDEERQAGHLANLTAVPTRGRTILAYYAALVCMGAVALAVALGLFAAILAAAGRLTLGAGTLALAWLGCLLGSLPLYALLMALALRFGRNATIAVGAVGLVLAFFSVGGLAHGLMTGALTGAAPAGILGALPNAWPARLGSLAIEHAIAQAAGDPALVGQVAHAALPLTMAAAALTLLALIAFAGWFARFEEHGSHA